jgi:hypothetical protein
MLRLLQQGRGLVAVQVVDTSRYAGTVQFMTYSVNPPGRDHTVEWTFETELCMYGQVSDGVVFIYDERRDPLTVLDESELHIEVGEQVMLRVDGEWQACEWGQVVNTVRFRRA